jgi:hypothetical protein
MILVEKKVYILFLLFLSEICCIILLYNLVVGFPIS